MSPGSAGAACYSRLRWALATIIGGRSGLAAAGSAGLLHLPGGVSAVSHLWWVLPALLRSGDLALTGGSTWAELLAEALEEVAAEPPDIPWRQLHTAALTHPLTPLLPGAPAELSPPGAGVGGDNETVWATGCRAESGTAAVYGAVARYVFDVGNWDNCTLDRRRRRIGRSGEPALRRSARSLVQMRAHPDALRLGRDRRHQPAADPPAGRQHTAGAGPA